MLKTLRSKLLVLIISIVTMLMAIITYFYTIVEINSKKESMELQMQRIAQYIATMQLLDRQEWNIYQNYISRLIEFNSDIVYIAIYDDRGFLRANALNTKLVELGENVISKRRQNDIVKQLDNGAIAAESQPDLIVEKVNIQIGERILGSVHVGFSIIELNSELERGIRFNIVLGIIFILVFGAVASFFANRLTEPLSRLSQAMSDVENGNLQQEVRVDSHDEIGNLANSFNEMVEGMRERLIIEQMGNELSAAFRLDALADFVGLNLKNSINAHNCRMYVRKDRENQFREITVQKTNTILYPDIVLDKNSEDYFRENKDGFYVHQAPEELMQILHHSKKDPAGLLIPILIKDQMIGFLFFELPQGTHEFKSRQIQFALTLSRHAGLALENALLYENLREKERMEHELKIARELQQKLLPGTMPRLQNYEISAACIPAQEVGGDFFDFYKLQKGRVAVVIADVCGKGTSAAFYMAQLKGMLLHLSENIESPKKLLIELNAKLYRSIQRNAFITMAYAVIDAGKNKISIARAGHNPIMVLDRNGQYQYLTPSGIGLGLDNGSVFTDRIEEIEYDLKDVQTMLFYTDGMTELMNENNEQFGENRLLEIIKTSQRFRAPEIKDKLLKEAEIFRGGKPVHDDITLIILKSV